MFLFFPPELHKKISFPVVRFFPRFGCQDQFIQEKPVIDQLHPIRMNFPAIGKIDPVQVNTICQIAVYIDSECPEVFQSGHISVTVKTDFYAMWLIQHRVIRHKTARKSAVEGLPEGRSRVIACQQGIIGPEILVVPVPLINTEEQRFRAVVKNDIGRIFRGHFYQDGIIPGNPVGHFSKLKILIDKPK